MPRTCCSACAPNAWPGGPVGVGWILWCLQVERMRSFCFMPHVLSELMRHALCCPPALSHHLPLGSTRELLRCSSDVPGRLQASLCEPPSAGCLSPGGRRARCPFLSWMSLVSETFSSHLMEEDSLLSACTRIPFPCFISLRNSYRVIPFLCQSPAVEHKLHEGGDFCPIPCWIPQHPEHHVATGVERREGK